MSFREVADELRRLQQQSDIEIRFSAMDALDAPELEPAAIFAELKLHCSAAVAETTCLYDTFRAYWKSRHSEPADSVFGEFTLQSVLEFGRKNILHPVFLESQYAGVNLRTTRVFDYYLYNGGPIFALLPVVEDRLLDSVLIFDKERLFKTTLAFADYLEVLRQTKGFLLWQYLYCEGIHPAPYEIDTMERGLQFVERAFPDGEYVDLKARLKAFM